MDYDIIVIGAGSGGLNIASFMNKVGLKVLLIDKSDESIGGDCLNTGCVPSKALIHVSKLLHDSKEASKFGIKTSGSVDIKKVTKYIKDKIGIIRVHENAQHFRNLGMDVELGLANFFSKNQVEVNGKVFSAKRIVLATGSRPRQLKIPGLEKVKYFTNENIFDIQILPKNLLVVGAGPIGIELGQAFQRLGSKVTVIQSGSSFLPRENPDVTKILFNQLKKEGMNFHFDSKPVEFPSSKSVIIKNSNNKKTKINFDAVLVSIGRVLNIDNLNLEKAGIKFTDRKIIVNDHLQTTNKNVFLCGDVAGTYQFTHAAELHASVILSNFFSPLKKKVNYDNFSWVTYTYPEIATFGLNEQQLTEQKIKFEKLIYDFKDDDRSIVDDFREGRLVLYISKNKLLGGSMVAPSAGELFQELVLAKSADLKLKEIFKKIYPYPTASRVNRRIISLLFARKLSEFSKKFLRLLY